MELSQKISLSNTFIYEPVDMINIFNIFYMSGGFTRNEPRHIKTVNNQFLINKWTSKQREDLLAVTYMIANNMYPRLVEAHNCSQKCFKNHVYNFIIKPFQDLLNHHKNPKQFYKTLTKIRDVLAKDYNQQPNMEYLIEQITLVLEARGQH